MSSPFRRSVLAVSAAALALAMSACMASAPSNGDGGAPKAHVGELQGNGPYQQFIVKYRDGSVPAREQDSVKARFASTAGNSGLKSGGGAIKLEHKLRLSVAADVFRADRPLSKAEAQKLMQTFAADPDVEYIEIDGVVSIMPIGGSLDR
ncbi:MULTISPECIES: hypothetical protein [unclassified Lysobacter]|uniref:hypothetical protein n=1 Tax=unclassified Lysobacter TaxID=2635362 RepID=UPI000701BFBE|nr:MULTISPECIES: hypothetical protein [unclassified Lysobacter]KRA14456.1 hypothetical protein ASD69_20775 [Lysobacter sp. Root604]KRD30230.1 hypothetical protein ASE35_19180 [Lysobacter sp. Root916]KRD75446.1 hypothetical protein ASE43_11210 [Lysobacter sp. Root983]